MTLSELQSLIGDWSIVTFGPEPTAADVIEHLRLEVEELAASHEPEEAADCLILLLSLAHRSGYDLGDEALRKHEVNTRRHWQRHGGHYRHVEEEV